MKKQNIADMITDAPTIEAEPVKHGQWGAATMTDRDELIRLIDNTACPDPEGDLFCPDRRSGTCREFRKLSCCAVQHLADHLLANGLGFVRLIPVTEKLPKRDQKCLCRYTFGDGEIMYFYQVLDYYASDPHPHFQHERGDTGLRVTHWMPLPELMKENGDETDGKIYPEAHRDAEDAEKAQGEPCGNGAGNESQNQYASPEAAHDRIQDQP